MLRYLEGVVESKPEKKVEMVTAEATALNSKR
jgi:hypothetical protein